MSFIDIVPRRGTGIFIANPTTPAMSIGPATYADTHKSPRHIFSLNAKLMERMRWVAGDKVNLGVDLAARLVKITRSPAGTYKLSGRTKEAVGKPAPVECSFTFPQLPLLTKRRVANWIEEGGAILVEWKD